MAGVGSKERESDLLAMSMASDVILGTNETGESEGDVEHATIVVCWHLYNQLLAEVGVADRC